MNKKVPNSACLVDVDLDKITCFAPSEFTTATSIFPDERLLDDEVWLREDAKLRAKCLLSRCEEMQRGAICEIEWCSYATRVSRKTSRNVWRKYAYELCDRVDRYRFQLSTPLHPHRPFCHRSRQHWRDGNRGLEIVVGAEAAPMRKNLETCSPWPGSRYPGHG